MGAELGAELILGDDEGVLVGVSEGDDEGSADGDAVGAYEVSRFA
jgi:hypothetical protein